MGLEPGLCGSPSWTRTAGGIKVSSREIRRRRINSLSMQQNTREPSVSPSGPFLRDSAPTPSRSLPATSANSATGTAQPQLLARPPSITSLFHVSPTYSIPESRSPYKALVHPTHPPVHFIPISPSPVLGSPLESLRMQPRIALRSQQPLSCPHNSQLGGLFHIHLPTHPGRLECGVSRGWHWNDGGNCPASEANISRDL